MIPLNQIFYGPPGTGKTFNVSIEAERIVNFKNLGTNSNLDLRLKFERILMAVREKYSAGEFKAKSNSIYRNDRAIMKMLGYIISTNEQKLINLNSDPSIEIELTKNEAIKDGLDDSSSSWSQWSQFISQFKLVQDWRDTTHLQLNKDGIDLIGLVKDRYSVSDLKNWDKDCPQEVQDFYTNILRNQRLTDFTPILKTMYCALNMLVSGDLYKQSQESRKPTEDEMELAKKYFDLKPNITDLKWIGHFGRILEGLGLVTVDKNDSNGKKYFQTTESGKALLQDIVINWENNYPSLFGKSLTYQAAVDLGLIHFITFHQSYSYEEFIEGIRPNLDNSDSLNYELVDGIFKSVCDKAKENQQYNYVVIIDEINRGNISKIFGELITLLEPTKRLFSNAKENPQEVTLPYSKNKFGVPNNVYVIGTMNTADRSITNIDTALRRRFSFKNFPPKPELLNQIKIEKNGSFIDLEKILTILNERIEYLIDKDHLIGHSYLMKVRSWDDLCETFRNNLIPLLQEYFYNDWDKIALVLGDTSAFRKTDEEKFVIKKKLDSERLFAGDYSDENSDLYKLNQDLIDMNYEKLSEQFFVKGFDIKL